MPYNPYYIQKQYPTYNQGYYGAQMNQFQQSMPNQNSFSAQGSFQPQSTQGTQTMGKMGGQGAMGAVGAGIQGATQIAGYINEANAEARAVPDRINAQQEFDPWGKPVYNLGQDTINIANTNTKVGKGTVGKSALTGVAAGASIGSVVPGIGTAIGAVVGGIVGGVAGLIGKGGARKRARKRKARAQASLDAGIRDFNQQTISYEQNNLSRQAYMDQVRTNNPYQFPTNYY